MDKKSNFYKEISNAINKANQVMGVAEATLDYMDEFSQHIHKGLVRPHVEYAS